MGQEDRVLEIPRHVTAHVWKLVAGVVLVALGALGLSQVAEDPGLGLVGGASVVCGMPLLVSNARMLVARPPVLRATSAGVWFGGGPIIPWQEIEAIYEAGVPIERYGYSVRTRAINVGFRRVRVMFRVPFSLWLTTFIPGHVKISLFAIDELPPVVVARLQAMRMAACGSAEAAASTSELPRAKLVQRT